MKVRALILAGGEGTRLSILTAKRAKPAVPFAGKYRIIDFPLSNCVNSNIFDVMIIAQYRPHSLIEHIGVGGPWDLNRDFTGGIRIYTPYKARQTGWFAGTADAVQQNFGFIKRNDPDLILILSGDHIYTMDYSAMIRYHLEKGADLTLATLTVSREEASRFGIVGVDEDQKVTSFVEKPSNPPSNLANMGVYIFKMELLNKVLWEDHLKQDSTHDFGKDIIPFIINSGAKVYAYPYSGYWVDVGTIQSYWQAHMDLLQTPSPLDLYDRSWIIHTRTEERAPVKIHCEAVIENSMICDGCKIESGSHIINSVISPGVRVESGAVINESIILTDTCIHQNATVQRTIIDKRAQIETEVTIGSMLNDSPLTLIGKSSVIPAHFTIEPGAIINADVIPSDYSGPIVRSGELIQTRRLPHEI